MCLESKGRKIKKNERREDLPFTSVNVRRGQRINFQDPDIRNGKVTRLLRLLVMLMDPNLKRNFIHILKSDSEISFRCSSHFLLALMISRSECGEREEKRGKKKKKIPKVLWLCSFINDSSPFVTAAESFDESLSWRKSSRLIILRGERSCFARPPLLSIVNYCHYH